jgi:outer membrane biogenesis lipoprotein LolB
MKFSKFLFFLCIGLALLISACASSQDNAYKAQEKIHQERLELVRKYQECLKKADEENTDKQVCEQYLKAAEALK